MTFRQEVLAVVRKIPKGRVLTYAEVARRAGCPRAARAAGNILRRNYNPAIPCHRVIRSDGQLGGYNRGSALKKKLLERERGAQVQYVCYGYVCYHYLKFSIYIPTFVRM